MAFIIGEDRLDLGHQVDATKSEKTSLMTSRTLAMEEAHALKTEQRTQVRKIEDLK